MAPPGCVILGFVIRGLAGLWAGPLVLVGTMAHPQARSSPPPRGNESSSFEDATRRAAASREAGRLEEATSLYREALRLRPGWKEGWWYAGTIAYDRDRFAECRDAFLRLVDLDPGAGPPHAFLGLCEFGLGAFSESRRHLEKALSLGPLRDESMTNVVLYHHALLLIRDGQFEVALAPLTRLLQRQTETPELVDACGLLLLRRSSPPSEVAATDRDLVRAAGRAYCAHLARRGGEARRLFEEALETYPGERHLHYGFGLSLAQQGSAEAMEQFRREIERHPDHVLAHVELAFNLVTRGEAAEARRVAEEAVRLAPGLFASHLALGRALVETGDVSLGIFELESAARLAPDIPEIPLALARAYARAGRSDEAQAASARFQALDAARREPEGVPTSSSRAPERRSP